MPDYRRAYVPGGTYFFTVVTYRRLRIFSDPRVQSLLGSVIRECQRDWPFTINAMVLLPDHLHTLWSLPPGDENYSARWSRIKLKFTKEWLASGGRDSAVSPGKKRERRRGVWQRRFWEHAVEDVEDFDSHFDYIHYNPVKHRYVTSPADWPGSSFHRWVKACVYEPGWGRSDDRILQAQLKSLEDKTGEPT